MTAEIYPQQIRELLQYVPQFARRVFLVDIDWGSLTDPQKADVMLDLQALQKIEVKLITFMEKEWFDDFRDWAIDFDLKTDSVEPTEQTEIKAILARGQLALSYKSAHHFHNIIEIASKQTVVKVIHITRNAKFTSDEPASSVHVNDWHKESENREFANHFPVETLLENGVSRIHFLHTSKRTTLLSELFLNEGTGLMIYKDSYRQIRPITQEDIPELLTVIGRSVRTSSLVPREYEDIQKNMRDYYVYQIDENIIGTIALHTYGNESAEIACLNIKNGHQGRGYGEQLVDYVCSLAKEKSVKIVFALTTTAANFFHQKMDFVPMDRDELPLEKQSDVESRKRNSAAFKKKIQ